MALPYNQIDAIANKLILKKMADGVFKSNAVLERFYSKREKESGGTKITAPLYTVDDTGSTGEFYSQGDALSLQEYEAISASEHDWKYIYESVVLQKPEIAKQSGPEGVLKLITERVMHAEKAMKQRMMKGILSDGAAATLGAQDADQFVGLESIIAASGSYGGIAPADLAQWVASVDDNSGVNRTLTQAILDKSYDNTVESGIGGATLGICDKNVFSKVKGLLTGFQRTTRDSSVSGLGHKGQAIVYNGIDYLIENLMPANTLFHIDEEHVKLHVHKDNDMRVQSISDLETADAMLKRMFLYGNLVARERRFNSRINDISV